MLKILLYASLILFVGGAFYSLFICAFTEVSMNAAFDYTELPKKIKIGLILSLIGLIGFMVLCWPYFFIEVNYK